MLYFIKKNYGFSLAGVRSDLCNGTEMYLIDNGNGHFTLRATNQLAIHQIYLYEGEIKFIVLNITHLGAG